MIVPPIRMAVTAVTMVDPERPHGLHRITPSRYSNPCGGTWAVRFMATNAYICGCNSPDHNPIQWPMRLCVFDWMEESIGWIVASLR